jgi:hypothetical protein
MLTTSAIAAEAARAARNLLGPQVVQDVLVRDISDEDGEQALEINFIVGNFSPEALSFSKRSELVRGLVHFLRAKGDNRFPFAHFATTKEMSEAASDD